MNGITKYLTILLFMLCVFALPHSQSNAAGPTLFAPDACDPDYYESLRARAWLEAQREITQNQNLIFKPDSVLEYTCFDSFLNHMAYATRSVPPTPPLFSMNPRWGTPAGNMEASLSTVAAAAGAYDFSNFTAGLLGGRNGLPYPVANTVRARPYACDTMNQIWTAAKCMNFIQNAQTDGFFTFADYADDLAGQGKRQLPTACTNLAAYQTNIDIAYATAASPQRWLSDDVLTYYEYVYPPNNTCGDPNFSKLQTGLLINRADATPASYNEYVCLVPGCHYRPAALDAGTCSRAVVP